MQSRRQIHPTHLQASGLSLPEAESLLRRPYGSLNAADRGKYVLLSQTPEQRAAWRLQNFTRWAFLWTPTSLSTAAPAGACLD